MKKTIIAVGMLFAMTMSATIHAQESEKKENEEAAQDSEDKKAVNIETQNAEAENREVENTEAQSTENKTVTLSKENAEDTDEEKF